MRDAIVRNSSGPKRRFRSRRPAIPHIYRLYKEFAEAPLLYLINSNGPSATRILSYALLLSCQVEPNAKKLVPIAEPP